MVTNIKIPHEEMLLSHKKMLKKSLILIDHYFLQNIQFEKYKLTMMLPYEKWDIMEEEDVNRLKKKNIGVITALYNNGKGITCKRDLSFKTIKISNQPDFDFSRLF